MRLFVELFLLAVLAYTFKVVRGLRIASDIEKAAQARQERDAERKLVDASENWMKNPVRDVRPARDRYIHDAPNWTSYNTEATGKFKVDSTATGRFKVDPAATGKFKK